MLSGYELVGHRGSRAPSITENTLEAFANALARGASAVELDVRMTRDRRMVVLHDASLQRTMTCTGRIHHRTWRFVRRQCRGERGGERLPSLDRVLTWAERHSVNLLLDVKRSAPAWQASDYEHLVDAVGDHGLEPRTRYLSFRSETLFAVRTADPRARLHVIARELSEVEGYRAWADAIHIRPAQMSIELVSSLHADGVAVVGRVANSEAGWEAVRDTGADGLLTDRLPAYRSWAEG